MKKKILIIGSGFAGIFAVRYLSAFRDKLEITVIDKKNTFDFLPMLPDMIGRGISAGILSYPLEQFYRSIHVNFINGEINSLDIMNNLASTAREDLHYDYLLIAGGSETNFYGNQDFKNAAYKLDSVSDAVVISAAIKDKQFDSFVISGGGYTGVELAANLRLRLRKERINKQVIIVERSPSILGMLPAWMKDYARKNLENCLSVEVLTDTSIERVSADSISLSGGRKISRPMLIWAAGVKTADFINGLNFEKNPQGRIKVDEYLRINSNCFVCGDCALVNYKGNYLRMAVQFAITQGVVAAHNIVACIRGSRMRSYKPVDLGYIIPMANNKSCGIIMGVKVSGRLATAMHFLMCIYRSLGWKNKIGIIKELIKGGWNA